MKISRIFSLSAVKMTAEINTSLSFFSLDDSSSCYISHPLRKLFFWTIPRHAIYHCLPANRIWMELYMNVMQLYDCYIIL